MPLPVGIIDDMYKVRFDGFTATDDTLSPMTRNEKLMMKTF